MAKYLKFKLSMPNNNSWNNKWTGDDVEYNVIRIIYKTDRKIADDILDKGHFRYDFGDGWAAGIDVTEVDNKGASKAKKVSNGFCGYEWMIHSIYRHNKIIAEVRN